MQDKAGAVDGFVALEGEVGDAVGIPVVESPIVVITTSAVAVE